MAPRTTAAKGRGRGPVELEPKAKGLVVVTSNNDADNILARPAFKASKTRARKSTSSFDRNIQKLLATQSKAASSEAENSAMAGSSEVADEAGDPSAGARQLRTLDKLLIEVTQLRQSVLSSAEQTTTARAVHNIDLHTDYLVSTVNEIQDELETRTDSITETATEINDAVNGVDTTVCETQEAVTTLQDTVDLVSAKIDALQEDMVDNAKYDTIYFESLRDRMEAMDDKLDVLIEMVQNGY